MRLRNEQIVFLITLLLLGWMVYGKLQEDSAGRGSRGGRSQDTKDFVSYLAPDVDRAIFDGTSRDTFDRDPFTPPRDTAPLPPLELDPPPVEPLAALAPPSAHGPDAAHMGAVLRQTVTVTPVEGLFATEDALDLEPEDTGEFVVEPQEPTDLDAEERAEQRARFMGLYDWIEIPRIAFGSIRNPDRYDLATRPDEPILFVEIVAETGLERFPGQAPVSYDRSRVEAFAFADTPTNRIELKRRAFGDSLRPPQLDEALAFASRCIDLRLEAPRALEVAEEILHMTEAVSDGDPRPKLGLARCYEAGFRFEDTLQLYRYLLENGHDKDPVVHTRLADLYARFRLFVKAEEEYAEALRWGRTQWEANWRHGRYLLERGRGAEALAALEQANRFEPKSPEQKAERAAMRADLGWAFVSQGQLSEALDWFGRTLSADPENAAGLAGTVSVAAMLAGGGNGGNGAESLEASPRGAGFDLMLAQGLSALATGGLEDAKSKLELATESDPFRSYLALRALSWLAEITGFEGEALRHIELAYDNDPTDPYTLYQRGRLLAKNEDIDGALASFQAALDQELDFTDALVAMGHLSQRQGLNANAERYYERALAIEEARPRVWSLRGYNHLALDDPDAADECFRNALGKDPDLASARNGRAWCQYLAGESGEAMILFADLIEGRRNLPETDAFKLYAQAQIERITEHESKEVWTDRFNRKAGRPANGWKVEEPNGLLVELHDGVVTIEGLMNSTGRTRIFQELLASSFVTFEATVTVHASTQADVGIFVSKEMRRGTRGEMEVQSEVALLRKNDDAVGATVVKRGESDAPFVDLITTPWLVDQPMKLRIERVGEGTDTTITLFVDGLPVYENVRVASLGRASSELRFGVFVRGDTARPAKVTIDDVEVVRKVQ